MFTFLFEKQSAPPPSPALLKKKELFPCSSKSSVKFRSISVPELVFQPESSAILLIQIEIGTVGLLQHAVTCFLANIVCNLLISPLRIVVTFHTNINNYSTIEASCCGVYPRLSWYSNPDSSAILLIQIEIGTVGLLQNAVTCLWPITSLICCFRH